MAEKTHANVTTGAFDTNMCIDQNEAEDILAGK